MIEELLPAVVVAAEAFRDTDRTAPLPAEEAAVARSSESRRREFGTARWCARQAMVTLGLPPAPIPRGPGGAPVWPAGVTGSLTHCAGYRAAALARTERVLAIGIDGAPHVPLPAGVLDLVARPEELDRIGVLPAGPICWDTLLFSAKESVFKAWQPLTGRPLHLAEASVTFEPAGGSFTVSLLPAGGPPPGGPDRLAGRWIARGALLVTAVVLPR